MRRGEHGLLEGLPGWRWYWSHVSGLVEIRGDNMHSGRENSWKIAMVARTCGTEVGNGN